MKIKFFTTFAEIAPVNFSILYFINDWNGIGIGLPKQLRKGFFSLQQKHHRKLKKLQLQMQLTSVHASCKIYIYIFIYVNRCYSTALSVDVAKAICVLLMLESRKLIMTYAFWRQKMCVHYIYLFGTTTF